MVRRVVHILGIVLVFSLLLAVCAWAVAAQTAEEPAPPDAIGPSPTLEAAPPVGAVVPSDMSAWHTRDGQPGAWRIEDGVMTSRGGDILSNDLFEDAQIHLEFREPDMPNASGQAKGNSGVAVQGRYEVQVLDSYGLASPGKGDCGAIYDEFAALVPASRPALAWQTYDIVFRSARRDDQGRLAEKARMTVLHNGIVIHNNVEIPGPTNIAVDADEGTPGPLLLQDHGCPVQYRNVWILHLPPKANDQYAGQ
jgi:hypothetical protein